MNPIKLEAISKYFQNINRDSTSWVYYHSLCSLLQCDEGHLTKEARDARDELIRHREIYVKYDGLDLAIFASRNHDYNSPTRVLTVELHNDENNPIQSRRMKFSFIIDHGWEYREDE